MSSFVNHETDCNSIRRTRLCFSFVPASDNLSQSNRHSNLLHIPQHILIRLAGLFKAYVTKLYAKLFLHPQITHTFFETLKTLRVTQADCASVDPSSKQSRLEQPKLAAGLIPTRRKRPRTFLFAELQDSLPTVEASWTSDSSAKLQAVPAAH